MAFLGLEWVTLPFATDSIKKLLQQWREIRVRRKLEIDALAVDFDDPEKLLNYYIEPDCQHYNVAEDDEDGDPESTLRAPAIKHLQRFFVQKPKANDNDGRKQMFVLSDAGMGKTSLLLMLKFRQLTQFGWPDNYQCELFKLGTDTLKKIKAIKAQRSTVLLLDALDEDPNAWDNNLHARLLELLDASQYFHRVVISCRTQFFPDAKIDFRQGNNRFIKIGGRHCPVIFLSLFDDFQVMEYLDKLDFPTEKRKKAETILEQMCSLRFRPMLLSHIEDLLESQRQQWNVYTIYEELLSRWLNRERRKLYKKFKKIPSCDELLLVCVRMAEYMQRKTEDNRLLSNGELKGLIRSDNNTEWLEKFDLGGRSLLNLNSASQYRFSHYSIQEFLLAYGIINHKFGQAEKRLHCSAEMLDFLRAGCQSDKRLYQTFRQYALTDLNLKGEDFKQADLSAVCFHGANLEKAKLAGATLDKADLRYSNLCHSQFQQAILTDTRLDFALFREPLKSGEDGPQMVFLPAGSFQMGSENDESEQPVHEVNLHTFAIARYAVTFAQYDAFCLATRRKRPRDEGWGREQRPVINVTHEDAMAYCAWLTAQTGQSYTLPSEAQWEYACRAGSDMAYCFGDDEQQLKDYAWYADNADGQTHPVGEKQPNAWGLYDMHGNVWEWCLDRWHDSYKDAPVDGLAWEAGQDNDRLLRGGSWYSGSRGCRSAYRYFSVSGSSYRGFRVVRLVAPRT